MSHPQDKVVSISSTAAVESWSAARMPLPLRKLLDKSRQGLSGLLQTMFDNADDALFELADRARSNSEQNIFFESMREVRLKRRTIESQFAQFIPAAFEQAYVGEKPADAPVKLEQVSETGLSLVQNDDLEMQVAIDGMIAKGMVQNAVQLRQLTQRIDSLMTRQVIDEHSNPLAPRAICHSFMAACAELDVEIKSKLVVFKLFDKFVVSHLEPIYLACNELLVEEGVLPGLELQKLQNRRNEPEADKKSAQPDTANSAVNDQIFASLQNLLAQQQSAVLANEILHSAKDFVPGNGPEIPTPQVMDLLADVQQQQAPEMVQEGGKQATLQPVDVYTILRSLLDARNVKEPQSLGRVDFDAINLVALLFQFILDDPNLATPMKALIGRLQIPLLKVAMLDKSFFSKGGHPARKLLNKIATAALGWTPSGTDEDPLLTKIETVVQRVLTDFDEDVSLFDEVLSDFEAFTSTESKRSNLIEKRTVDAEDGRARADAARQTVQAALNEKVADHKLPPLVLHLLQEAWSNVLFLACLKEGVDGDSWTNALTTVDDLLWSVRDHAEEADRSKLLALLPDLLKRLRNGLSQISYDSFKMNELFSELEQIHLKKLRAAGKPAANDSEPEVAPPAADLSVDTRQAVQHDEQDLQQDAVDELLGSIDAVIGNESKTENETPESEAAEAAAAGSATATSTSTTRASTAVVETVVERIVLSPSPGKQQDLSLAPHEELSEDNEFYLKAEQLHVGTWVEMRQNGEKKYRAKLAAITKPNIKYIFVNRAGMKVSERSLMGLAVELQRRTILLLDDSALFDRALQSVIGNLRSFKKVTTT